LSSNISIIRKKSLLVIVGFGLFLVAGLSFVNIYLTGFLLQLVKLVSGIELNGGRTYLILLVIILAWYLITAIRGGILREFRVEENTLSVKKLTGPTEILHKNEIQRVEWKKNRFVFHRIGPPFSVTTPDWAMANVLFYWMPENLLPLEVRHFIKEAKDLAEKPTPVFEESLRVGTKSGSVELNNEGIEYKTLLGQKFFRWSEIEIVEIRSKGTELKIWVKGRYTRVKLPSSPDKQGLLRESFLAQVYTRGIPVCYSETRF
jgi:hypothetical protein